MPNEVRTDPPEGRGLMEECPTKAWLRFALLVLALSLSLATCKLGESVEGYVDALTEQIKEGGDDE